MNPEPEEDPKAAFLGDFRLLKRVAAGGMAEVFAARVAGSQVPEGLEVGDLVALKRLLPGVNEDEGILEMFHSEARLSSQLSHPHIARSYGMTYSPLTGEPVMVMDYVGGADLGELLRLHMESPTAPAIPPPVLNAIALQALDALAYVQGLLSDEGEPLLVVHRDISPQNLRLQPDGVLKLLDFGIARFIGRDTDTLAGTLKGKVAYMSPEQVDGVPLDARSDLFALGVLLYELATAARLFRAENIPDTLDQVRRCEVQALVVHRPDVGETLRSLIMKCLSRERDARPESAAALLEQEEKLLEGGLPESRTILQEWFLDVLGPERVEEVIVDEIGPYHASLVSAEDRGEETTDTIGVADATQVLIAGQEAPPYEPEPLPGQARVLLYAMAIMSLACVLWMAL